MNVIEFLDKYSPLVALAAVVLWSPIIITWVIKAKRFSFPVSKRGK